MSHMTHNRLFITVRLVAFGLATVGALAVAGTAFFASWHGLTLLAEAHGLASIAPVLPLSLDGLVLASTMGIVHAHLVGRSARVPWLITLAAAALSAAGNAVAAALTAHWSWLAPLLWGLLPVLMTVAFHQVVTQAVSLLRWFADYIQTVTQAVVGPAQPATRNPMGVTHEATPTTQAPQTAFHEATQATPPPDGTPGSSMEHAQPVTHEPVEPAQDPEQQPNPTAGLPTTRPAICAVPPLPAQDDPVTHDPDPTAQTSEPEPVDRAAIVRGICDRWAAQTPPRIATPAAWKDLLTEDDRLAGYTRPDKAIGNAISRWDAAREKVAA
jgi:hypothetical protein